MKKKEIIEKALDSTYCETLAFIPHSIAESWDYFLDTLAEQAIVIECEVEHGEGEDDYTVITIWNKEGELTWWDIDGHHGSPGKALAIIIPLEEE